MIGDPAVRNRGTIGGSISNNDPAADYPAAVVGLNATVHTTKREIAADNFFTGMFETALEPAEIVTAVRFPKPQAACYQKFRNPASRYAIVGVFVARTAGGVRVAVTGAGPCVFRVPEMEAALARSFTPDAIKDITIPDDRPQLRHPRQRRIPRPPRRRHGPPRRRRLRVGGAPPNAREFRSSSTRPAKFRSGRLMHGRHAARSPPVALAGVIA